MAIRNIFLVLLGGCSFGILSTFVKLAYGYGFSLADVTSAQAYFGAVLLWMLLMIYRLCRPKSRQGHAVASKDTTPTSTALRLILTGMASGCISISYYKCVEVMPASIAIILLMQYTWISIVLERLLFKISITPRKWLFVSIVLVGTILGSGLIGNNGHIQFSIASIGFGLMAGFFYAVFVLASGYVGNALPAIVKSSWIILGVVLIIMAVFPPFAKIRELIDTRTLSIYLMDLLPIGLLLAFFGMVLPPLLFAYAIPKVGVALSSILGSVELPTAALCAYLILNEPISVWQLLGILIILCAIILIHIRPEPKYKTGEIRRKATPTQF
ncbi:DMT family transporter [Arachidicoccus ginsenosidivorans]|jgi:drug/metabolite transporter (DMT)-like permease|uniref:EamA family transporter n=1 Tax=Arachidicoccus ginsenosidivorans TaxID=496057 RepID=A0A5B8VQI4_9BACT|nr:DMT family transporter [Arachidicoccus ginsenosidivorans]QEC73162.1 EamA family transporter [Arachidicoccus ginsenosidivorans]